MSKFYSVFLGLLLLLVSGSPATAYIEPAKGFLAPEMFGVEVGHKLLRSPSEKKSNTMQFSQGLFGELEGSVVYEYPNTSRAIIFNISKSKNISVNRSQTKEEFCFEFLNRNRAAIYGDNPDLSLSLDKEAVLISEDFSSISHKVLLGDYPIENNNIDCRFKKNSLVQVAVRMPSSLETFTPKSLGAVFDPSLAVKKLGEGLRVVRENGNDGLMKVVNYLFRNDTGDYRVQVNEKTGRVYEVRSLFINLEETKPTREVTILGTIYDRYYGGFSKKIGLPRVKVRDGNTEVFTDDFGKVRLENTPNLMILDGSSVETRAVSGYSPLFSYDAATNTGEYLPLNNSASNDLSIAHMNVYFHTDKLISYAKKYIDTPWLHKKLLANVNLTRTCNAHWDGTTINFYVGDNICGNTGLISDVVYHEWGHGLDAKTGGIQDGAFSEGFGDIMSIMMTGSPVLGIGFRLDGSPVRHLEEDKIYPQDVTGAVHADGLIIGSTFYDLYQALTERFGREQGVDMFSRYSLQSIFAARTYNDVYDALIVMDDDDEDLENGTPNLCLINSIFRKHGLADKNKNCMVIETFDLELNGLDRDYLLPGETAQVTPNIFRAATTFIDNVKIDVWSDLVSKENFTKSYEINRLREESSKLLTPFEFTVPEETECGSNFKFYANAEGGRHKKTSDSFEIVKTIGKKLFYETEKDLGKIEQEIKDKTTVEISFMVEDGGLSPEDGLDFAKAEFNVSHNFISDVKLSLVSPNGLEVDFYKGRYGHGKSYQGIVDNIADLFENDHPGQKVDLIGEWKLKVADLSLRDEGVLHDFKLSLRPLRYTCEI